ncbi:hypothetical protein HPQ64_10265 [Rhizobiales bacterium]|uniref:hypothetical protein n=1 Tax=Hongsoonwoonella zoysiae TaxID=2821844 RepID=UPI00156199BF|nr:hypothetical protein [Hongsoonwoonella zoysiae]NRG18073.1 hypothetical protein [Hongsoonwoonella zoysiae]
MTKPPIHPSLSEDKGDGVQAIGFAIFWALAIGGAFFALTIGRGHAVSERSLAAVALFSAGGFLAALMALGIAGLIAKYRPQPSARFAAMFIALTLATAGITALLFYLQFRIYYSQWHEPHISRGLLTEIIFTLASSGYIFGVKGVRLLTPVALPLIFAVSFLYARRKG